MQNSTMIRLALYLNGHYAGKTIKLGDIQFTDGKVTLYGPVGEVSSLANYLGKCYQAWPKGQRLNPETGEIVYEEENPNGASTVQQEGRGNVGGEIREEERPTEKVPTDDGTGPDSPELRELRGDTSRDGYEDPRVPSPESRFDDTSTAKIDPEKLLDAMGRLDPENKDHWRKDGQPMVDAVAKLYGSEGLTRKDLQAVWPELTQDLKRKEAASQE